VFSQQEQLGALDEGTAHLLEVAPRYAPRITTRLRVNVGSDSESCSTSRVVSVWREARQRLSVTRPRAGNGWRVSRFVSWPSNRGAQRCSRSGVRLRLPRPLRIADAVTERGSIASIFHLVSSPGRRNVVHRRPWSEAGEICGLVPVRIRRRSQSSFWMGTG
jgi:hypothetical protein